MHPHDDRDLDWLLNSFVERIRGASAAVVVSSDGLVLAMSERIAGDHADQLAAVTSGLASLTAGAARCFSAGVVSQVVAALRAEVGQRGAGAAGG